MAYAFVIYSLSTAYLLNIDGLCTRYALLNDRLCLTWYVHVSYHAVIEQTGSAEAILSDSKKNEGLFPEVIQKLAAAAEGDAPLADQIEQCFDLIEGRKRNVTLEMIAKALQLEGVKITSTYIAQIMARVRKSRGIARRKSKKRAATKSSGAPANAGSRISNSAAPARTPAAVTKPARQGEFDRNTGRPEQDLF